MATPSSMMYRSGGKPVAISSTRRIVRVTPEGGTSGYEPDVNPVIRLELSPSLGFVDTHQSYLSFRVKTKGATVNHTKECRLDENCMSWVRDFTIYSSTGAVLENLQHYNLLVNLLHKTTCPDDYKQSIGRMIDNQGSRAVRNGAMAHPAGSVYNSGFDASGILGGKSNKMLPCGFFQGPIVIEITLAPMKDCFVFTAAANQTASYQIDNVEYHAHCLSFSEEYNSKFSQQLRERGVDISFDTFKTHNSVLTDNTMDLSISQNAASVKGVYHILRDKGKYQHEEYDSLSTYKSGNLEEIQWDMGGKLTPEFPLKLKDDGITNMYSHNLQSWNMFRNLSLGCSVDDTNFASTEAIKAPKGNFDKSYTAMPVRRVYGTWVANGKEVYDETKYDVADADVTSAMVVVDANNITKAEIDTAIVKAVKLVRKQGRVAWQHSANNLVEFTHTVSTLSFVPDNVEDISLVEMGMRCKMGLGADDTSEATAVGHADIAGATSYSNLELTDMGLDRFFKTSPADPLADNNTNLVNGANVMYAGSPCNVAWAHTKGLKLDGTDGGEARDAVAGLGVPFVDGQRRPILSKSVGFKKAGWVDVVPSDKSFYIGCSFETHPEEVSLVSGSDLTSSTPLHVRLRYNSGAGDFYEPRQSSDPFTSFVYIDAVLRLTPSGELISSV